MSIDDSARMTMFLMPWKSVHRYGGPINEISVLEILAAARKLAEANVNKSCTERPYRDMCGWDRISVDSDDRVSIGEACIRFTSNTNMAPCARNRGVTYWRFTVSGLFNHLVEKADDEKNLAVIRKILEIAGVPQVSRNVVERRAAEARRGVELLDAEIRHRQAAIRRSRKEDATYGWHREMLDTNAIQSIIHGSRMEARLRLIGATRELMLMDMVAASRH